jgi:uracil-DNA glycosylase
MDVRIEASWKERLGPVFASEPFARLTEFVKSEYKAGPVFPPGGKIFRAFDLCPIDTVRVVILGQDPYHGPGQANGLCFSVNPDVDLPPSLKNIFQELESDLGRPPHADRTLEHWARQGVLLLNSTLTVRSGAPTSHSGQGWEEFTDAALQVLAARTDPTVFILWGAYAQRKGAFLDGTKHLVIKSPHPSPLSSYRGFFGSRPFSRTNRALESWGKTPIDW